jgi:FKBP-type peptidyl-prolyl cis-trans isomerase FkpA
MKFSTLIFVACALLFAACAAEISKTPNGYEFTKHTTSNGAKPAPGDYAYCHIYVMYDDSLVHSTRNMGKTVPINVPDPAQIKVEGNPEQKPNPIVDVVGLMSVGDSVTVHVPMDDNLRQRPELKNVTKIAYNVVLVEAKNPEEYQASIADERKALEQKMADVKKREQEVATLVTDIATQYSSGKLKDKLQSTSSGLKYMIVEEGTGAQAQTGNPVSVQYYGVLTNGAMFDNSFQRGRAFQFNLGKGEVIGGWDEGIALLKEGSKAVLFVPANLGYGPTGSGAKIPPNSELIFYVELEKSGS